MTTSFQDSRSQLNQRMVDLLWHQWSSIGVAGYARPDDPRIIDPEALILATTRYGRYDSRLMDESMDWLMKFGNRISVQLPGVQDTAEAKDIIGATATLEYRAMIGDMAAAAEAQGLSGAAIGQAVHTARTEVLNSWLANGPR